MFPGAFLIPFLVASLQSTLSGAFSWHLTTTPKQCSNLTISIIGSDGQPPYHVLVMPYDSDTALPVVDKPFDGNSTNISFLINYPANSSFVAVVSDATGFGTGGASQKIPIANSDDASCFNSSDPWSPSFSYGVGSDNQLTQCQPTTIWWNATNTVGKASFSGIIPGGQCFGLSETNISNVQEQDVGFAWTPDLRGGTDVMIVAGDNLGLGRGGCTQFTVQPSNDTSCFDNSSPTSTPGSAAGTIETNAAASGTSNSAVNNGPNVGIIVGATIGGIIGLAMLIVLSYYCLRKDGRGTRRFQRHDPSMSSTGHISSPASRALSGNIHRGADIVSATNDPSVPYQPGPFPYAGFGTHNYDYPKTSEGYMPMRPSRPILDNMTGGSGTGTSDTSTYVGSPYGIAPSRGASPGLQQTNGLPMVRSESGGNVYDTSSQMSSRYVAPSVISSTPGPSHLRSRGDLSTVPYDGWKQTSGLPNLRSERGGSNLYDTSNQMGYGATSMVSSTSEPAQERNPVRLLPVRK